MKHRELFERIAARTLTTAFDECPMPTDFHAKAILDTEGIDRTVEHYKVADSTLDWLHSQGFLSAEGKGRIRDEKAGHNYREYRKSVLTPVGLAALDRTVDFSGKTGTKRVGDFLSDQLKQSGGEARKSAISEIVGGVIGAAARAYMGDSKAPSSTGSCLAGSVRL
jgi:hypothetical protein